MAWALDAARQAVLRPTVARPAIRLLEGLGAHTVADHVDRLRSGGDLVAVRLPAGTRSLRTRRFRMHALDDRDQVVRALRTGGWLSFEAPLPSVVARLVHRWPHLFLDVGANTGFYSLLATTADRRATAMAFEPVPEVAALLRANLAANPQGRRVEVREAAVGDTEGAVDLHLPPAQADGTVETSASLDPDFKGTIERVVQVEAHTLDGVWTAAGRPPVGVVKIDVEGVEARVLAGAAGLLDGARPVVTIEVLPGAAVGALDEARARHRYADVTLSPVEAVVGRPQIAVDERAPNHLLVPQERLDAVVAELAYIPRLAVTRLA